MRYFLKQNKKFPMLLLQSGQSENLCLDNLVSAIDSQRVIVLNQASDLPGMYFRATV